MTKTNYVRGPRQNHVYLFITAMKLLHSKAAYVLWNAVGLETWTQARQAELGSPTRLDLTGHHGGAEPGGVY